MKVGFYKGWFIDIYYSKRNTYTSINANKLVFIEVFYNKLIH